MPGDLFVRSIEMEKIVPNPYQPRQRFEPEALKELADSIACHGVLQPVTVRRVGGLYELIAGERRLRAAQMAGFDQIPAIVVKADEEESAVLALIENIQRQDLSYMEEALAYQRLARDYHMTQEEIARIMGKTQSAVANKLRILRLTEPVKHILSKYGLTERHARALLKLTGEEEQLAAARYIAEKGLNVRECEAYIESVLSGRASRQKGKAQSMQRPKVRRYIRDIRLFTNTVNKAVSYMQEAGVPVQVKEKKAEGYYEMMIRVPYRNESMEDQYGL